MDGLIKNSETINRLLARYGVKFGIYKNGEFKEQLFPFDPIPIIIESDEFAFLERGLIQRVNALNCFLSDIYGRKLIIKDVAEAGGYGVVFGSSLTKDKKQDFIEMLKSQPRRFIAQEVIDFYDLDILDKGERVPRKADLRAFVPTDGHTKVWPSGLTRFSRNPDSFIVNSSQGGGFKDTWVLSR